MSFRYIFFGELKNRFLLGVLGFANNVILVALNKENALFFVTEPFVNAKLCNSQLLHQGNYLIFNDALGLLGVYIGIVLFAAGLALTIPIALHAGNFVSTALRVKELNCVSKAVASILCFLIISPVVVNLILIPVVFELLLKMLEFYNSNSPQKIFFEASVVFYWSFCKTLYYQYFWGVFTSHFLVLIGFYFSSSNGRIVSYRKSVYATAALISTLVAPPDVISQVILFLLAVLVFEFQCFCTLFYITTAARGCQVEEGSAN